MFYVLPSVEIVQNASVFYFLCYSRCVIHMRLYVLIAVGFSLQLAVYAQQSCTEAKIGQWSSSSSVVFGNTIVTQSGGSHYAWTSSMHCDNVTNLTNNVAARSYTDVLVSPTLLQSAFFGSRNVSNLTASLVVRMKSSLANVYLSKVGLQTNISQTSLLYSYSAQTTPLLQTVANSMTTFVLPLSNPFVLMNRTCNENGGPLIQCPFSFSFSMQFYNPSAISSLITIYCVSIEWTAIHHIQCPSFTSIPTTVSTGIASENPSGTSPMITTGHRPTDDGNTNNSSQTTILVSTFENINHIGKESTSSSKLVDITIIVASVAGIAGVACVIIALFIIVALFIRSRRKKDQIARASALFPRSSNAPLTIAALTHAKSSINTMENGSVTNDYAYKEESELPSKTSRDEKAAEEDVLEKFTIDSDSMIVIDALDQDQKVKNGMLINTLSENSTSFVSLCTIKDTDVEFIRQSPEKLDNLFLFSHNNAIEFKGLYFDKITRTMYAVTETIGKTSAISTFSSWINTPVTRTKLVLFDYVYYCRCIVSVVARAHRQNIILNCPSFNASLFTTAPSVDTNTTTAVDNNNNMSDRNQSLHYREPKLYICNSIWIWPREDYVYVHNLRPPESAKANQFTKETDMWYVGLMLWHIFDPLPNPMGRHIDFRQAYERIRDGFIPEKPRYCPEDIFKIISKCWEFNPRNRMNAESLEKFFNNYYAVMKSDPHSMDEIDTSKQTATTTVPVTPSRLVSSSSSVQQHQHQYVSFDVEEAKKRLTREYANVPSSYVFSKHKTSPVNVVSMEKDEIDQELDFIKPKLKVHIDDVDSYNKSIVGIDESSPPSHPSTFLSVRTIATMLDS